MAAAPSGERTGVEVITGFPPRSSTVTRGIAPLFVRTSVVELTCRACAAAWSGGIGWFDGGGDAWFVPEDVDATPTLWHAAQGGGGGGEDAVRPTTPSAATVRRPSGRRLTRFTCPPPLSPGTGTR